MKAKEKEIMSLFKELTKLEPSINFSSFPHISINGIRLMIGVDATSIDEMDELKIENVNSLYDSLDLIVENVTKNETYKVHAPISQEDIDILMAGGALNYIRNQQ